MYRSILLLLLSFVLVACGDPKLQPLSYNATIVAFGDSLTHGVGAGPNSDYPTKLAELSGFEVINAGISGENYRWWIKTICGSDG